jgi:hypothetical protein
MDWEQFLKWASNPSAIPVIVGVLLSIVTEYVPAFTRLQPKWKRAVFFGITVAVPLLAAGLGILTTGWPATWEGAFWPALVAGVMAFGSGTLAHLPKLKHVTPEE